MIVRARAPLRISFGGGGTDVPPYVDERGGAVLSVTIDKYAYCDLSCGDDGGVMIRSLDYGVSLRYDGHTPPPNGNELTLLMAVLRRFRFNHGIEMFVHSDSPPGSGLGSSSAMAVAAVGAAWKVFGFPMNLDEIARTAHAVERTDAGIPGGRQDQYAATYGGFNFIEFHTDRTDVERLEVSRELLKRLEASLVLCFTGKRRLSANIINQQVQGYKSRQKEVVDALDSTKALAYQMREALFSEDLERFGGLLNEAWACKRKFSPKVSDPQIDAMYEQAIQRGALGGKLLGAGAGGFMILLCPESKRGAIETDLVKLGGEVVPFRLQSEGLTTRLAAVRGGR